MVYCAYGSAVGGGLGVSVEAVVAVGEAVADGGGTLVAAGSADEGAQPASSSPTSMAQRKADRMASSQAPAGTCRKCNE